LAIWTAWTTTSAHTEHPAAETASSDLPTEFLDFSYTGSEDFPFFDCGSEKLLHTLTHHLAHTLRIKLPALSVTSLSTLPSLLWLGERLAYEYKPYNRYNQNT
jgi:hypothetical protein